MNIRDHILAGHYPTDDKGRALVPTTSGRIATICATDKPGRCMLVGWVATEARALTIEHAWPYDGLTDQHGLCLLPPPPRKVKVTAWAICNREGQMFILRDSKPAGVAAGIETLVELTGEYEEPWS